MWETYDLLDCRTAGGGHLGGGGGEFLTCGGGFLIGGGGGLKTGGGCGLKTGGGGGLETGGAAAAAATTILDVAKIGEGDLHAITEVAIGMVGLSEIGGVVLVLETRNCVASNALWTPSRMALLNTLCSSFTPCLYRNKTAITSKHEIDTSIATRNIYAV